MNRLILLALFSFIVLSNEVYSQLDSIWSKTYDFSRWEEVLSICPTIEGGCVLTGKVTNNAHDFIIVLNLNHEGDTLWSLSIGDGFTENSGYCIKQTTDSCFILTGFVDYKIYLLKINSLGDTLWSRTYGQGVGFYVEQTSDQGYIIAGTEHNSYGSVAKLIKTNSKGDFLWSKKYDDFVEYSVANCVKETLTGEYIVGCHAYLSGESKFVELFLTDSLGNIKWKILNDNNTSINSILVLPDGTYIGTGYKNVGAWSDSKTYVRIIKTNEFGQLLFEKEYGTNGNSYNRGNSIELLKPDNYIIAASGEGYGDVIVNEWAWILSLNSEGDTIWTKFINYTDTYDYHGGLNSIGRISGNKFFTGGWLAKNQSEYNKDLWVSNMLIDTTTAGIQPPNVFNSLSVLNNYPNPFTSTTTIEYYNNKPGKIKLTIYSESGKIVKRVNEGFKDIGRYKITFSGENYPSGIYYYKLENGRYSVTKPIILTK